jgi:hypothetical protein
MDGGLACGPCCHSPTELLGPHMPARVMLARLWLRELGLRAPPVLSLLLMPSCPPFTTQALRSLSGQTSAPLGWDEGWPDESNQRRRKPARRQRLMVALDAHEACVS